MFEQVLSFWFEETDPKKWWKSDPDFDDLVRQRFLGLIEKATQGELYEWRTSARGRLAEVIVLDQFPRNIYRDTPEAFSRDPMALVLAQEAVASGALLPLAPIERAFLLMPYMHSESRAIHVQAETLFHEFAPRNNYEFELKHKVIVDRFGRYPHRNRILGRDPTDEELEFLKQPGSSF